MSEDDVGFPGYSVSLGHPADQHSHSIAVRPSDIPVEGCCVESATQGAGAMNKQEEQIEGFGEELEEGAGDSASDEGEDDVDDCEGPGAQER